MIRRNNLQTKNASFIIFVIYEKTDYFRPSKFYKSFEKIYILKEIENYLLCVQKETVIGAWQGEWTNFFHVQVMVAGGGGEREETKSSAQYYDYDRYLVD